VEISNDVKVFSAAPGRYISSVAWYGSSELIDA